LSRDGKWLAYTSDRGTQPNAHIYVQQILRGEPMRLGDPIPLTSGEAEDSDPSFSPVVAEIVFHSYRPGRGTDEIYSIPVSGGEPKLIARRGQNPRYSPDGKHIAYWEGSAADLASPGKIYVVGADGGVTKQLAPDLPDARYPIWSPNGKYLLVPGRDPTFPRNEALDWWLVPVDGGSAVKTNASDILRQQDLEVYLGPGDWTGDWVLFSARIKGSSANLWRLRIVPNTGEFTGRAQRVTLGTADEAQPSVAAGGLLVFSSLKVIRNIWRLPVDADRGKVLGNMQRLTSSEALDINPSLSADGKRLVFLSNRSESWSIWRKDLESGKERALSAISSDGSSPIVTADASFPIITADGSGVAYSADEDRRHAIYTMPADGGVAERRCADCGTARSWSSDQKSVLYVAGQTGQIGLLNLASGQKTILLQHPDFSLDQPQFSPDDHWIAFVARGRGGDRARLCIAPFKGAAPPAQSEWIAVTDGQAWDDKPQWSPAGTFLYFYSTRDGFGCVWKQRLDQANKRPRGEPAEIWPFHKPGPSLSQTFLHAFEIAVAHDKIVLNAVEITGNIWWTRLPE
jgi:Tol biopolymer transport system component